MSKYNNINVPQDESSNDHFDRDAFVQELTLYYQFLINLYLPPSCLRIPPSNGWPDITTESYAWLKKSDTVIDLLQHLPFIERGTDHSTGWEIDERTFGVECNGPLALGDRDYKSLTGIEPGGWTEPFPPSVLVRHGL